MKHYLDPHHDWGSDLTLYRKADGTLHLDAGDAKDPVSGLITDSERLKIERDENGRYVEPVSDAAITTALGALEI